MTRTDVVALSGPQTAGTGSTGKGSPRALRRLPLRRLLVLPVVLLLAAALATPALAASKEPLTTYTPKTKTTHETLPAKEKKTPAPAPVTATEPAKAASTTLPFTGFDLRWTVGIGLFLVFAGGSIMVMQRRRHDSRL